MALSHEHQQIIDKLYTAYELNGFITEDEVLDLLSKHNVSLRDTDSLIGILLSKGIMFSSGLLGENDDFKDYGFINYELIFSEIIQIDPDLKHIINHIKNIRPPQRNEFDKLYLQAKNGNSFAKNRILEMYMRQAIRQALYFSKRYYFPIADCIQEAFIGLILGFEKYDINRSHKFPIHIIWSIRQKLYREISITNNDIVYPVHIRQKILKIHSIFKNKSEKYILSNKNIIIKKITDRLMCSKINAFFYYNSLLNNKDIDKIILSDYERQIENINEEITICLLNKCIKDILSTIPRRESEILLMRYSIDLSQSFTLDEVGDYFGLTRERIRQIETKAIRRLRHPKRSRILAKFLPEFTVRELSDKNLPKNEKFIE